MIINLLIESFKPKNPDREKEYLECLKKNIENEYIDYIHIFNDDVDFVNELMDSTDKIYSVDNTDRMTYKDFFEYSNEYLENEISIIANSDIIFDESIKYLKDVKLKDFFFCLTRYDIQKSGNLSYPPNHFGTQDSWVYISPIKTNNSDFCLGMPGCDNKIPYVMEKNGYDVSNPSKKIITKHLHLTGFRTYDNRKDLIDGDYIYIHPTDDVNVLSKKNYAFNNNGNIKILR